MKVLIACLTVLLAVSCMKKDPMVAAEKHLALKMEYLKNKAKILKSPNLEVINIHSQFPKSDPMPNPWVSRIQFTMVHRQEGKIVLEENFQVTLEFESPIWVPVKMESEKRWAHDKPEPWKEITRESNKEGWQMINSILGLYGP